jgi:hypothetical protein
MKKLSLTSVIIVFVFSLCYPMGPMVHCSSVNHNELSDLTCYCCSGTDKTCAMFACCNCNHDARSDHSFLFNDTLLSTLSFAVLLQPTHLTTEKAVAFKTVHCDVPYKPPKS